jgi:hypothetical protein
VIRLEVNKSPTSTNEQGGRFVSHLRMSGRKTRSANSGIIIFFGCLASLLLIYGHEIFVNPVYGYLGLPYVPLDIGGYLQLMTIVALPGFLLPRALIRVSSLVIWIIYYFCFIPVVTMVAITGLLSTDKVALLQFSVVVGFVAIVLIPKIPLRPIAVSPYPPHRFWLLLVGLFGLLNVWIIVQNASVMTLVSVGDTYTQRFAGSETVGLSAYAMGITSGSINPFLMAYGLLNRKWRFLLMGMLGQLVIYSVMAQKFVMLSVLYIPGFYLLMGGSKNVATPLSVPMWRIGVLINILLVLSLVIAESIQVRDNSGALDVICDIILMRLFVLPGALVAQYALFFDNNPVTYSTHIGVLKFFFESPYLREVSLEIGSFLAHGGQGMNANSNFFGYDGVASFGLVFGPALAGIFVGAILLVLDLLAGTEQPTLMALTATCFAYTLCESSAFTTLVTGGGFVFFLLAYLYRATLLMAPDVTTSPPQHRLGGGWYSA